MTNILLAEDHPVVRMGMVLLLKETYTDVTVEEAVNTDDIFRNLSEKQFDLLLLDINIPGGNSTRIIKSIKTRQPALPILVISGYDEEMYAIRYLKSGVEGYIQKDNDAVELKRAIQKVLNHEIYTSERVQQLLLKEMSGAQRTIGNIGNLSDRELEIMNLLIKGLSSSEIKMLLNIELSTISTFKSRLFSKMGVSNVVKLVEKVNALRN